MPAQFALETKPGDGVELVFRPGQRWIQRNRATGTEIEILPPWKAIRDLPAGGRLFDSDFFDW